MNAAPRSPPFVLQIVDVNMAAFAHIGDNSADIMSVLHHGVANFQVTKSDLVTERDGIERLEANGLVGFHDPTGDFFARLDVFDNDNANGVGFIVHDEISGHEVVSPPPSCL
jgi:hypothetical protein